jgi:hypothetical protein
MSKLQHAHKVTKSAMKNANRLSCTEMMSYYFPSQTFNQL